MKSSIDIREAIHRASYDSSLPDFLEAVDYFNFTSELRNEDWSLDEIATLMVGLHVGYELWKGELNGYLGGSKESNEDSECAER